MIFFSHKIFHINSKITYTYTKVLIQNYKFDRKKLRIIRESRNIRTWSRIARNSYSISELVWFSKKYQAPYVRENHSSRFKNETSRRYFLSYLTVKKPSEMSNTAPPAIQLLISRKSPSCVAFCPRATMSSFSTAHLREFKSRSK